MSNWPLLNASATESVGLVRASSRGTDLASGAAHTWSSWVQLTAATSRSAEGFLVNVVSSAGCGRIQLLEIGIGASGSEVTLFGPFAIDGNAGIATEGQSLFVPIRVPEGARIAARVRNSTGSNTGQANTRVSLTLFRGGGLFPVGMQETFAVGLSLTTGSVTSTTQLDSGATANTAGAWVELTASTPVETRGFYICQSFNAGDGTRATYIIDVGIGASAAEVVVASFPVTGDFTQQGGPKILGPFPLHLPAGTRIAARSQSSSNAASSRNCGVFLVLIG